MSEKIVQVRAASSPVKGTPGKGATPASPEKAGPAAALAKTGRPQEATESSSSSSEESDSEQETPTASTLHQVRPGKGEPLQAACMPTPLQESQMHSGVPLLTPSVICPVWSSVSSCPPSVCFTQGKPLGKAPQVRVASATAKDSPRKGAPPAPPSKTGPAAARAKAGKQEEESESSGEEESDSDGKAPAAMPLTAGLAQVRLQDTHNGPVPPFALSTSCLTSHTFSCIPLALNLSFATPRPELPHLRGPQGRALPQHPMERWDPQPPRQGSREKPRRAAVRRSQTVRSRHRQLWPRPR